MTPEGAEQNQIAPQVMSLKWHHLMSQEGCAISKVSRGIQIYIQIMIHISLFVNVVKIMFLEMKT